nr:hypothetical protein [Odoribacter splanchnicus]
MGRRYSCLAKSLFFLPYRRQHPRKERQQIIEAWTSWSDFQFTLNRYRGLASCFLKYYRRMLQETESLLNAALPEISPESQTTNQEGGI